MEPAQTMAIRAYATVLAIGAQLNFVICRIDQAESLHRLTRVSCRSDMDALNVISCGQQKVPLQSEAASAWSTQIQLMWLSAVQDAAEENFKGLLALTARINHCILSRRIQVPRSILKVTQERVLMMVPINADAVDHQHSYLVAAAVAEALHSSTGLDSLWNPRHADL